MSTTYFALILISNVICLWIGFYLGDDAHHDVVEVADEAAFDRHVQGSGLARRVAEKVEALRVRVELNEAGEEQEWVLLPDVLTLLHDVVEVADEAAFDRHYQQAAWVARRSTP